VSILENTCLTVVNVYATVYSMWTDDEITDYEAGTGVCETCGERDVLEALTPVYVATKAWHAVEKFTHAECREQFVLDNLEAVLGSLRMSEGGAQ